MKRSKLAAGLALAVFTVVLLELLSLLGLFVAGRVLSEPPVRVASILRDQAKRIDDMFEPGRREVIDPVLGWRYLAPFAQRSDSISAQGIRSVREYSREVPAGITRVSAFGDSFVYGTEVGTRESWAARVEESFPELQVLNFGVGGYGVDQALLRYRREAGSFDTQFVLLGFFPDDLRRGVNVYRRFISASELPLAKPRFRLVNDTLVLVPAPLPTAASYDLLRRDPRNALVTLGRFDQWYRPEIYENPLYDWSATVRLFTTAWLLLHERRLDPDRLYQGTQFSESAEAFRLHIALFQQFAREVAQSGARPLVVFFPDRSSVEGRLAETPSAYEPLVRATRAAGVDAIDVGVLLPPASDAATVATWFAPGGHYSPQGNRLVAEIIGHAIRERNKR